MEILQGEDDLGVVVRSHIVVEQYLNHLIETVMANPECYQSIKIDFHDKVKLAISLGLNPRFQAPLNTLGTLRNDFSHNLRPELSKQDVKNIYSVMSEEDKKVVQSSLEKTKKKITEENIPSHQALKPKEKFTLYVVTIAGALHVACNQYLTSKGSGRANAPLL